MYDYLWPDMPSPLKVVPTTTTDKTSPKKVAHGVISIGNDYKMIDYLQALGKG